MQRLLCRGQAAATTAVPVIRGMSWFQYGETSVQYVSLQRYLSPIPSILRLCQTLCSRSLWTMLISLLFSYLILNVMRDFYAVNLINFKSFKYSIWEMCYKFVDGQSNNSRGKGKKDSRSAPMCWQLSLYKAVENMPGYLMPFKTKQ